MELICRFLPSFISLFIYFNYFDKKKDLFKMISYYAINVVINNLIMMLIMYFIFKREYIEFTVLYSAKYLLLSSVIAILMPMLFKKLPKLEKFIKSGFNEDKDFSPKMIYKNNRIFFLTILLFILNTVFFFALDINIRKVAIEVSSFNTIDAIGTNLFTLFYCILFISIIYYLPRKGSKIFSIVLYSFSILLFLTHFFLLKIKGEAFTIYEINNAGEGAKYLNFIFGEVNKKLVLFVLGMFILGVICFIVLSKIKKENKQKLTFMKALTILLIFILGLKISASKLEYIDDDWLNINSPKYYYINMVNPKNL